MQEKFYQKKWVKITAVIILISGGFLFWKADSILGKISTKGGLIGSVVKSLPMGESKVAGERSGQINIVLLGMRGKNVPGGGQLADTIMVASVKPAEKKVALVSVPRDLYVTVPGTKMQQKINAVYYYGEQKKEGQGLEDMKTILSDILGEKIHYAVRINFKGFEQLVDSLDGIKLHLKEPFEEPMQFREEHVCDENVFTVPTGNFEEKKNEKGKVVAKYPLCRNTDLECGGIFKLPAGDITLNGEQALCYVRSRVTSSDFDRARRQQEVLQEIKSKALSVGTLTNFSRINSMLSSLDENVKTDMEGWEMKRFWEIYNEMGDDIDIRQKVLENSEEGLLYSPEITTPEQGYILLPRGDNYKRIREMFKAILN